jgi:hypothetical protein
LAIKTEELKSGCISKAADNEPLFVLRAQDMLAPELVREWAVRAAEHECSVAKVNEAFALADKMEAWPNRKFPD